MDDSSSPVVRCRDGEHAHQEEIHEEGYRQRHEKDLERHAPKEQGNLRGILERRRRRHSCSAWARGGEEERRLRPASRREVLFEKRVGEEGRRKGEGDESEGGARCRSAVVVEEVEGSMDGRD